MSQVIVYTTTFKPEHKLLHWIGKAFTWLIAITAVTEIAILILAYIQVHAAYEILNKIIAG